MDLPCHGDLVFLATWHTLLFNVSTGTPRPFVPGPRVGTGTFMLRHALLWTLHTLSYPGIWAIETLVTARFVCRHVNRHVRKRVRFWLPCEGVMVYRHTRSHCVTFSLPTLRLEHVHIDLVAPLSPARGDLYLFTHMNHFTS